MKPLGAESTTKGKRIIITIAATKGAAYEVVKKSTLLYVFMHKDKGQAKDQVVKIYIRNQTVLKTVAVSVPRSNLE